MEKILGGKGNLVVSNDLFVEQFYLSTINKETTEEIKLCHSTDIRDLEIALALVSDCMDTHWIQQLQLRSSQLRCVLEVFRRKTTCFLMKTHLYSDIRLRDPYLMLYYINYNFAARVSAGNLHTEKLWSLPKTVLISIKKANFNFQADLANEILADHLPLNNYCHYKDWLSIDSIIQQHPAFQDYPLAEFPQDTDKFFWIFSQELCDYFFNKVVTTFFRQSILFMQQFESKEMFVNIKDLITSSWICFSPTDLIQFLLWSLLNILSIDHIQLEHFNKVAVYVEILFEICLTGFMIPNEEVLFTFLQIGRQIISKGTYSVMFPIYFKIIKMLLGWTILPADLNIDHAGKLLDTMNARSDSQTSLIDLLEVTTRLILFYRSWTLEFRTALFEYVLTHINTKDINKRLIYMGIISFMNRTLRKTDYIFEAVSVSHTKFVNQNGYVDMYLLKEAFRQIRYNIKYSNSKTTIFNKEQLEELGKITEDCIPSTTYQQYLSLPFDALKCELSKESTVKNFQNKMMTPEKTEAYMNFVFQLLQTLISEYSEELNEDTLYVDYSFVELLIDTKGKMVFDKDLQIYSTLKVICMFLGYEPIKKVFDRLSESYKHEAISEGAEYNKVVLSFYSAFVGAAAYYSEEEYKKVLDMGKQIMKPFFNSMNAKFLESFIQHLNRSLKGNLSYKKLKMFFQMVKDMMNEDVETHHVYYLNILIFQITISQMILTDDLVDMFKEIMETSNFSDMSHAGIISRMFRSIFGVRLLIAFNDDFIKNNPRVITEDLFSTTIYDKEKINFDDLALDFLREMKDNKTWVKLEGLRHIAYTAIDKKITSNNLPLMKKIIQIAFGFTTRDDFNDSSIIPTYRGLILDIRKSTIVQRHIKENVLVVLLQTWKTVTSYECYKGLLSIYRIGYSWKITENVHKFIKLITRTNKMMMQEEVRIFMRDDLFLKLSDNDLYEYSNRIIRDAQLAIEKM